MASGEGIDSIEIEPVFSTNKRMDMHHPTVAAAAAAMTTTTTTTTSGIIQSEDDDEKEKSDGRGANIEFANDPNQSLRAGNSVGRYKYDRERKLGHRRVGEGGEITYKKIQTTQIMGSIQLGIQHTVGSLASKPKRDLLMMDFWELETISFPPEGSSLTPAHHYSEFRFKIYAPIAFRYFRDLFGIQPDDFMMSMCSSPLRELSNPGASGSIFYLTDDDEFIIKTVQHKEGEFLQKLLPGYYMNLNQNPRTLLPKFFGLYCFQCNSKNVRLIVMNNLLPSYVKMHLKYDLKGSTYNRKANKTERGKSSPTYKDLDFMEQHPNGIFLEADTYSALVKTIQRDCRVLESFKIMDYSLLVGVHNLDLALKAKQEARNNPPQPAAPMMRNPNLSNRDDESDYEDGPAPDSDQFIHRERDREREERERGATALNRSRSINRQRLVAHSTAMESIQAESEPIDEEEDVPPGGIPARSEKGERLLLFIGIIDILQSYRFKKKLEHTFKSIIHDGDTVSVCRPSFYAQRFQDFMAKTVFKKIPSPLKHSPSKRKSLSRVAQQRSTEADSESHQTPTMSAHTSNAIPQAKPIVTTAPSHNPSSSSSSSALPPLKQKTGIVKSKVPPPVPPRGSPKSRRSGTGSNGGGGGGGIFGGSTTPYKSETSLRGTPSSTGTAPSCCSTPPPAFDDISEGSSSTHRQHHHHHHHHHNQQHQNLDDRHNISSNSTNGSGSGQSHGQGGLVSSGNNSGGGGSNTMERRVQIGGTSIRNTSTYREDTVSISEIRLDTHLAVDTSSGSHYGSRSGLTWTPPASVEGSTPTWTEGTPSFTESSSSGDMDFSGNSSPLNTSAVDRHKPTVEEALNSLTSEMTHL